MPNLTSFKTGVYSEVCRYIYITIVYIYPNAFYPYLRLVFRTSDFARTIRYNPVGYSTRRRVGQSPRHVSAKSEQSQLPHHEELRYISRDVSEGTDPLSDT